MEITVFIFLLLGTLFGGFLLAKPTVAIWTLLIMAMLVGGSVTYFFPQFATIRWGIALISLALFFLSILESLKGQESQRGGLPLFMKVFFLLFFLILLTTAGNLKARETIIAAKNFFQFWSVPLAFYYIIRNEKTVNSIMKAFLFIAVVEVPIAIIQNFFFTSASGMFPGDSVTGTFGGQIAGGGPNAALSIFLTVQIAMILSLSIKKLLRWRHAIIVTLWYMIPILLSNAKAIILFISGLFIMLFWREVLRRPLVGLLGLTIVGLLTVGVGYYHYKLAWQYGYRGPKTFLDYTNRALQKNIATDYKKQLNRSSAIIFWWDEHSLKRNSIRMLFGHGLGAAKHSGIVLGHVAAQTRYRGKPIGFWALPRLLWDIGLIGTVLYTLIFVTAFFKAGRMKTHCDLPDMDKAFMMGAQIACLFFLMSLPYQLSIINVQAFNAFSMFILGYIAFWSHRLKSIKADSI